MRKTRKTIIIFLALIITVLAGCGILPQSQPVDNDIQKLGDQLRVHFIDVGQGDAILIQTPEQNILVDGGERGSAVVDYLKGLDINELDLVIGTHAHSDHIGGLIDVLSNIPVKEVIDPAVVHTTKTFEDYLTLIDQKDIKFTEGRAGMTREIGGGTMQILHPATPSSSHLNDSSVVTKITFGQLSFLLTGDVERESEIEMLARKEPLKSTILKSAHHGSSTSSTLKFVKAVAPEVVVIMCGKDNKYGHPHEETLKTFADLGVDIYRTDLQGTIVITTDGQTCNINVKEPHIYTPSEKSGSAGAAIDNLIFMAVRPGLSSGLDRLAS
jgi:competence protein ComEC